MPIDLPRASIRAGDTPEDIIEEKIIFMAKIIF